MMKNRYIPRSEILNLYTSSLKEVSTFTISEWLRLLTEDQFIVIERAFVLDVITYIELNKYSYGFLGRDIKEKWDLEVMKSYI
jgi:hypothetical protein